MAKIKPTHYTTIMLDLERTSGGRWIGYTWQDIEDLSATLKLDLLGDNGMLMKAGFQNPRALNMILLTGMKHWDPQLQYERVSEMVQECLNAGGKVTDLITVIYKAMRMGGFLGEEAGAEETASGPLGPGQAEDSSSSNGASVGPAQETRPLARISSRTGTDDQPQP